MAAAALFPGDRAIWRAAAVASLAMGVVLVVALAWPREVFTGSTSVSPRSYTALAKPAEPVCARDIRIPGGTGRIRYAVDPLGKPVPRMELTGALADGTPLHAVFAGAPSSRFRKIDLKLDSPIPAGPSVTAAKICIRPSGGDVFIRGRDQPDQTGKPIEVGGKRIDARLAIWFLPRDDERRPLLAQLGAIFRRASMFRPGFVGPWTYWLLLFGVMPALIYSGVRLVATARLPKRRIGLPGRVFAIALAVAASWALVTPAFQSPDESEHMAAAQYFAETGKAVEAAQTKTAPWSTQEAWAIDQTYEYSTIEHDDTKAPWDPFFEQRWAKANAQGLPRDDGGGFHPATSIHSPAYYALLAPAYFVARSQSPFSQLLAMRLTSALMGALTAMLAMLIVLELAPGRRELAVAAGLLVAFLPQFGFISGAVNNDNGVNLGVALCVYLLVRALRRGLTVPVAITLGAALVATPLLKGTGYEIYPPAAIALVGLVARRHGRRDLAAYALLALAFALCFFGWDAVRGDFQRSTFTTPGGGTPGNFGALHNLRGYAVWLWQILIPVKLPFMQDYTLVHWPLFNIYVERGFAGFGWYAIFFPKWVYVVIVGVMAVLAGGGLRLLWTERAGTLRRYLPEALFIVSIPVVVLCAVEAAYFTTIAIPLDGTPEQGRYLFPAITALAVIVVAGCVGLSRRRGAQLAAALVAGLAVMTLAGQWLTFASFYT